MPNSRRPSNIPNTSQSRKSISYGKSLTSPNLATDASNSSNGRSRTELPTHPNRQGTIPDITLQSNSIGDFSYTHSSNTRAVPARNPAHSNRPRASITFLDLPSPRVKRAQTTDFSTSTTVEVFFPDRSADTDVSTIMEDDDMDLVPRPLWRPFTSSSVFQTVMAEMYANLALEEQSYLELPPLLSPAGSVITQMSHLFSNDVSIRKRHGSVCSFSNLEDVAEVCARSKLNSPSTASKSIKSSTGWQRLRRHMKEANVQSTTARIVASWRSLVKSRSFASLEQIREDLYQRYGVLPMIANDGTLVQENVMLSDRARKNPAYLPRVPQARHSVYYSRGKTRAHHTQ